ncbi:PREDICTED: protein BOBBER 2-like [Camelina sativa]|uniref:Protein BOBBER 2-like n=1 Tax=Camelina sativa TaxID=90675 RepID=A0ABM0WQ40_CAMSA|nr:PREDICTED: protein BOBBER 2-like [Camelina sativa]
MEEVRLSTLPLVQVLILQPPLGFLEKVLKFIEKESNFLKKDTAEKDITDAVTAVNERLRKADKKKKTEPMDFIFLISDLRTMKFNYDDIKQEAVLPRMQDREEHKRNKDDEEIVDA